MVTYLNLKLDLYQNFSFQPKHVQTFVPEIGVTGVYCWDNSLIRMLNSLSIYKKSLQINDLYLSIIKYRIDNLTDLLHTLSMFLVKKFLRIENNLLNSNTNISHDINEIFKSAKIRYLYESFRSSIISNLEKSITESGNLCIQRRHSLYYIPKLTCEVSPLIDLSTSFQKQIFLIQKVKNLFQINRKFTKYKHKDSKKYNRDCILKKIKSRFFKFYINDYVLDFCNYLNKQKVFEFKKKVYFFKLKSSFIKDVTLKNHKKNRFLNLNMMEIFNKYSDTQLEEQVQLRLSNPELFNKIFIDLDPRTKFIMLNSFKNVFKEFINNKELYNNFLEDVSNDNVKDPKENIRSNANYIKAFAYNMKRFIVYLTS